jgi:hypothetical protein
LPFVPFITSGPNRTFMTSVANGRKGPDAEIRP